MLTAIVGEKTAALLRGESLRDLMGWTEEEFRERGCSAKESALITAALSLGRQALAEVPRLPVVSTSREAADLLRHLELEEREVFVALLLDMKNRVKQVVGLATGALQACVLRPRDVFRLAVKHNAAHMILAHNHPSGDPAPSQDDTRLTSYLARAGEILGIDLVDHVIIGHGRHFSFRDSGMLAETQPRRLAAC